MDGLKSTDRLAFLAKKFDVFETDEKNLNDKKKYFEDFKYEYNIIETSKILAIVYIKNDKDINPIKSIKHVSISFDVFSNIIEADPTPNKSYVQWMLNTFSRYLKAGGDGITQAIRFIDEDLPHASNYITLFEANKRKQKFKKLCSSSYILANITDPTDINQYKSLSQLYDAVDPFIERNPSELESLLERYVNSGQAMIPVRDRKFTLFIPLSLDASVIFEKFVSWCTSRNNNGMFASYTNRLTPFNEKSKLYIIINNKFFTNESDEIYQIHFESRQIKNKNNTDANIFESVINESEGISNFLYNELIRMAKENKSKIENNLYLDYLIKFGFCESLFEIIEDDTPTIRFMSRDIPRMPDISKFKSLDQLIITNAKMIELHSSIGKLTNLEMLVLSHNRIKILPIEIGQLNKLIFLNLVGNPIEIIPDEIKYLDRSNGGSLFRLAINKNEIGEKNYKRLKELLPTTNF
jgi:hypothetical protein